jgi:hypothetical protein
MRPSNVLTDGVADLFQGRCVFLSAATQLDSADPAKWRIGIR